MVNKRSRSPKRSRSRSKSRSRSAKRSRSRSRSPYRTKKYGKKHLSKLDFYLLYAGKQKPNDQKMIHDAQSMSTHSKSVYHKRFPRNAAISAITQYLKGTSGYVVIAYISRTGKKTVKLYHGRNQKLNYNPMKEEYGEKYGSKTTKSSRQHQPIKKMREVKLTSYSNAYKVKTIL